MDKKFTLDEINDALDHALDETAEDLNLNECEDEQDMAMSQLVGSALSILTINLGSALADRKDE